MCEGKCKGRIGSFGAECGDEHIKLKAPSPIDPHNQYDKGGISARDYITAKDLNYSEGCILKYVTRHQEKNGKEDLAKAMNYLEYLIDNYEDIYRKGDN